MRVILYKENIRLTSAYYGGREVKAVMSETLEMAKRIAPKRSPRPYDRRPTGRLQRSLKAQGPKTLVRTVSGRVGSKLPWSLAVHDGANPHEIVARRKKVLSFWWERHNVRFAGRKVNHPGVRRGQQYLWIPLNIAARRRNFKTRRLTGPLASGLADI